MTDATGEPRIVNIDDADWSGVDEDGGRWKRLGRLAGGSRLGCTLEEIQPGGRPAKYHYHLANEEALYVIEGDGTLRTPAGARPIRSGDYVTFPVGRPGGHAVENTSDAVLRCLLISTMEEPDLVVYPDEGTFAVSAEGAPGRRRDDGTIDRCSRSTARRGVTTRN